MDVPNIPGLPPGKKGLLIAGGVGLLAIGGIFYFKRRTASSGNDGGGQVDMPQGAALLYSPSGGGSVFGGSGVYANSDPLAGAPTAPPPAPGGTNMWDALVAQAKTDQLAGNASILAGLGLKPGDTANLTNSDAGTSLTITPAAVKWDASQLRSSDIRAFIADQEAKGVPINAASIGYWQQQYGLTGDTGLAQVGAAFGMDLAGAKAWMSAHPGSYTPPPVSNVGQGGQTQTGGNQTSTGGTGAQTSTGGNAMYTGSGVAPFSDAEITGFLQGEEQRLGRALTSADIRGYSAQYAVPINQIGRAYGMDAQRTDDWLRTH